MDEKKKFEISDEALKQVIGGVSVGDRVKVDAQWCAIVPAAASSQRLSMEKSQEKYTLKRGTVIS